MLFSEDLEPRALKPLKSPLRQLCRCNCSSGRARHIPRVSFESASQVTRWARCPILKPRVHFVVADVEFDGLLLHVDNHGVTIPDSRKRSSPICLRRYMAHHESVRSTREAAICDKRDGFTEPFPNYRAGYLQHLRHSGAASWTFVSDDHNITRMDAFSQHGIDTRPFIIEHASRAGMSCSRQREFHDAPFRS